MTETVLVTGASGFIGKETVIELENAGYHVIKGLRNPKLDIKSILKINLKNPKEILELERNFNCDVIVHLGARVGLTGENDSDLYLPNVLSSGCLAYLANSWEAKLIFASTVMIYGVSAESIHPDSLLNPDTPYARSKFLAEQLIQTSGADNCIFRIAGVFGKNGPEHLGLNRAIMGAIHEEIPTQINSGKGLRNYIYVKDVAKAISYAIKSDLKGVHLLAGSESLSINQMLQSVCDEFLPRTYPTIKDGKEAHDQIIDLSNALPNTRSFKEALKDIHQEMQI